MAGARGRSWINSVQLLVRRPSQPNRIAADRSPSSHVAFNVTFIGGVKALNPNIVTEFACDRTIVAVADVRSRGSLRSPAQPQAPMAAIAVGAYGHFPSGVVASARF
jgi:hypothetical protein